ncbi:zinc finger CCCH domain-containing protein 62-like isoform X4 [Rhododendron vialii]|uniref:zinc finger CCCH domain-containing protein 62-like isoform X4 n=1 Tax=Rhododendron vialii TaxID=182163 RepID=UPI00265E0E31|nr:zinc finger CCCH domain-containing protein 62-like isoform X4 [Rhododendron vialii]
MTERRGNKRTYIQISSSSSGDDEEEEEDRSESQSESESEEYDGSDDDECVEIRASSTPCDDEESGSDDEDDESDDDKDENDESDEESRCNSVIRLLRERSGLQELNLKDCRAYLRKHGLRITGTKVECIQRIMEHWRIKDGNAEALFPRSSFTINCTGDVCKGDTVLFTQKVYKKFDKVTRSGTSIGKRTVAGRVVKESYGAAKQQHTFTVEVLWSKGMKKLPPLFPLLVKGRNLYKLKTFRQRWKNETERHKVLAEKHKRGAAARLVRAKMKTKKACSKNGGVLSVRNVIIQKERALDWRKGSTLKDVTRPQWSTQNPVLIVRRPQQLQEQTWKIPFQARLNLLGIVQTLPIPINIET